MRKSELQRVTKFWSLERGSHVFHCKLYAPVFDELIHGEGSRLVPQAWPILGILEKILSFYTLKIRIRVYI